MNKTIAFILFCFFCSLGQVDSLYNLPKEDEDIYKSKSHEFDISSRLSQMNDTANFANKYKNGKRNRDNIVHFVQIKLPDLSDEYNKRLMDKSFKGKITVEFNVLSDGSVISCKEIESNIKDTIFIKSILSKILKWKFPKLQIQNDTTKVVYPFLFSL
jgi:hypothetical protein